MDRLIPCLNPIQMQVDPINNPDEKRNIAKCKLGNLKTSADLGSKCETCQAHRGEEYVGLCLSEERDGEVKDRLNHIKI